jgi:small-conductance mechanosensitive channel
MSKMVIFVCLAILFIGVADCFAQGGMPAANAPKDTSLGYPVLLGDQTLCYVRDIKGPTGKVYTARERAKQIAERIKEMAEDPFKPVTSINVSTYEQPITLISAGNDLLMAIFDEDAIPEGRTRSELAAQYSQKLRAAVEKYRRDRSLKWIITGTVFASIATLVLIAILYVLSRLYRKAETTIQAWVESEKASIHVQSLELVRAERAGTILTGAMRIVRFFLFLGIFYAYLHIVLNFFPWTRLFASRLSGYVLIPLRTIGLATLSQIPNLIFLSIIVLIAVYFLKLMRLFFKEIKSGTITFKGFYAEWADPTYRICRVLVIAFAAIMAFPYIPGSASPAFKGISIFAGVLFSLGSTSAIANIIAGYMLTYRRVFKVGDRVQIADYIGDVVEMRLQVTHLRTIKNEEIIVPNSTIVNSHVVNYSSLAQKQGLILHTDVTIGYDVPWRQVEALLLTAAERTRGLLREPGPFVLQRSLNDFHITYELNAYTDAPQTMARVYSELHKNIQDLFNQYGVQIMSPAYRADPERPKIVPQDKWYAPPAKPPDDPEKKT